MRKLQLRSFLSGIEFSIYSRCVVTAKWRRIWIFVRGLRPVVCSIFRRGSENRDFWPDRFGTGVLAVFTGTRPIPGQNRFKIGSKKVVFYNSIPGAPDGVKKGKIGRPFWSKKVAPTRGPEKGHHRSTMAIWLADLGGSQVPCVGAWRPTNGFGSSITVVQIFGQNLLRINTALRARGVILRSEAFWFWPKRPYGR